MALTGLHIFKLLPKTNCGECGVPTCMAFAMKLAAKNAELARLPVRVRGGQEDQVGAASKPPIRLVKIGPPEREVAVGNETVMFRHEKTFVHPTAIAMAFSDDQPLSELCHQMAEVREYCLERVGEQLRLDLVLVENTSGAVEPFVRCREGRGRRDGPGMILKSDNPEALEAALQALDGQRPLIHAATPENAERIGRAGAEVQGAAGGACRDARTPWPRSPPSWPALGVQDIVLDLPAENPAAALQYNTIIRKMALKASLRAAGLPDHQLRHRAGPAVAGGGRVARCSASTRRSWWSTRCSTRCCCR